MTARNFKTQLKWKQPIRKTTNLNSGGCLHWISNTLAFIAWSSTIAVLLWPIPLVMSTDRFNKVYTTSKRVGDAPMTGQYMTQWSSLVMTFPGPLRRHWMLTRMGRLVKQWLLSEAVENFLSLCYTGQATRQNLHASTNSWFHGWMTTG